MARPAARDLRTRAGQSGWRTWRRPSRASIAPGRRRAARIEQHWITLGRGIDLSGRHSARRDPGLRTLRGLTPDPGRGYRAPRREAAAVDVPARRRAAAGAAAWIRPAASRRPARKRRRLRLSAGARGGPWPAPPPRYPAGPPATHHRLGASADRTRRAFPGSEKPWPLMCSPALRGRPVDARVLRGADQEQLGGGV
jgi:hypothetical protein